ncbi:hypothetical protein Rhein_0900 [Rheinheimera sp. A13L]|uniref:iron-containing redox enzyme family protein n=1 Tax=Rheinheimera sp. A13L TaxID=506534 RepID=UPI0002124B9D|nr:iron-containing redox enzyme family protein [Rheinheimera sp. A13L]EGM79042.1 hypothetical protein Rhein_0900 [Rheinheimera sp. A13L]
MMYSVPHNIQPTTPALLAPLQVDSRQLYFAMLDEGSGIVGQIDELSGSTSRSFLQEQLSIAAATHSDFPATMLSLPAVLCSAQDQVAQEYRHYLDERSAGSPRRYFGCRSHAMYFLRAVAPTKLVDGAWLYGLLQSWQDPRLTPLIRTYLEELGCGNLQQNHVLIYKRLLARYGCEKWQDGPTAHFTQGAVQLALAHHADEFLPELIGFNLGYEQLPLHLLITAYELNELNIDPYYFTLHVSIDNASTGHARLALQSLQDCTPRLGDAKEFYRRVGNGYRLNQVGMGTQQVIASFDLEQELLRVISDKAQTGAKLHSDYCLVGGRLLSEWLSSSAEMADLLKTLQSTGWIRRGESLEQSRFWHLLTDEQAPMFGVFDGYELQLLKDWILNDANKTPTINRFRIRATGSTIESSAAPQSDASIKQIIAHHANKAPRTGNCAEVDILFSQLTGVDTKAGAFAVLTGLLSPANHPTPAGLAATRLYADLFLNLS